MARYESSKMNISVIIYSQSVVAVCLHKWNGIFAALYDTEKSSTKYINHLMTVHE